jgi:hypothetical protein
VGAKCRLQTGPADEIRPQPDARQRFMRRERGQDPHASPSHSPTNCQRTQCSKTAARSTPCAKPIEGDDTFTEFPPAVPD